RLCHGRDGGVLMNHAARIDAALLVALREMHRQASLSPCGRGPSIPLSLSPCGRDINSTPSPLPGEGLASHSPSPGAAGTSTVLPLHLRERVGVRGALSIARRAR